MCGNEPEPEPNIFAKMWKGKIKEFWSGGGSTWFVETADGKEEDIDDFFERIQDKTGTLRISFEVEEEDLEDE